MNVPFVDLKMQYRQIQDEVQATILGVLESQEFIQGEFAKKFAHQFLSLHGGSFGVGCSNGTSAIALVLRALGIGPGDEVLVPNNTFIGTVEPIVEVGAVPVLVEVNDQHQLDIQDLNKKITMRSKALIAVHLYGMSEDLEKLVTWCTDNKVVLLEDCAQAHLAMCGGRAVGTFGAAGTFSFYPGKNLGAYGDAGFVLSNSEDLIQKVSMLLDHGRKDKYLHQFFGGNNRIDGIQAAILSVKLKYLQDWTNRRQQAARRYDVLLEAEGFKVLKPIEGSVPAYHLYVVEVSNRDSVLHALKSKGIGVGIHYPIPLNCQPAFSELGYRPGQFKKSEYLANRILSLPLFPEITEAQIQTVVDSFLVVAEP